VAGLYDLTRLFCALRLKIERNLPVPFPTMHEGKLKGSFKIHTTRHVSDEHWV
jgi:hypothetical protein